jgi:AraC-like DNA-binding protein
VAHRQDISVAFLRPFATVLARLDADANAFLAAADVATDDEPTKYVAAAAVDSFLEQLARSRNDPCFGLTLARAALSRPVGLFGHMVWLSGTLRDAMVRAASHYSLNSRRARLLLDESQQGTVVLEQQATLVSGATSPILTEYLFASLALRARQATNNQFAIRSISFRHSGTDSNVYLDVFGIPVAFSAPRDAVVLDAQQLLLKLDHSDEMTSAAIEAKVVELTTGSTAPDTFLARVQLAINESIRCNLALSPKAIAAALAISPRTLRRHLEHEGQSLRTAIQDVQRRYADNLLGKGAAVKEVAFALGFSEPSAFSRAYKKWTGKPPHNAK